MKVKEQVGDVGLYHRPNHIQANIKILMDDTVSHSCNHAPRNATVAGLCIFRNNPRSLTNTCISRSTALCIIVFVLKSSNDAFFVKS